MENSDDLDSWRPRQALDQGLLRRDHPRTCRTISLTFIRNIAAFAQTWCAADRRRHVATPYLIQPLARGADIVVHSVTQYLGGHGAAIAGVIVDGGTPSTGPTASSPASHSGPELHRCVFADLGPPAFALKARVQLLRDLGLGGAVRGTLVRVGADIDRSSGHRDDTDYRIVQARAAGERRVGAVRLSADAAIGARQFGAATSIPHIRRTRPRAARPRRMRATAPVSERVTLTGALHRRRHSDVFTLKRGSRVLSERAPQLAAWRRGDGADRAGLAAARLSVPMLDGLRSARLGDRPERADLA